MTFCSIHRSVSFSDTMTEAFSCSRWETYRAPNWTIHRKWDIGNMSRTWDVYIRSLLLGPEKSTKKEERLQEPKSQATHIWAHRDWGRMYRNCIGLSHMVSQHREGKRTEAHIPHTKYISNKNHSCVQARL